MELALECSCSRLDDVSPLQRRRRWYEWKLGPFYLCHFTAITHQPFPGSGRRIKDFPKSKRSNVRRHETHCVRLGDPLMILWRSKWPAVIRKMRRKICRIDIRWTSAREVLTAVAAAHALKARRSKVSQTQTSPERQRRGAKLLRAEALAAFSLSLDNSISILAWIFSQSTSTWGETWVQKQYGIR